MDQDNLNVQGEEACEVENDIIDGKIESDDTSNTETDVEVNSEGTDDEKLIAANHKANEYLDKLQRTMAEYDNFRKRTIKEKTQMYEIGAKSIVEKILPIIDNFERGLAAVPEEQKADPFVDGMDKVYKQLLTELESVGVTPIEAIGTEFNPDFHNAVMQVESEEYESGIVAQELQKGYMYRESVVRHSMVAVVQ